MDEVVLQINHPQILVLLELPKNPSDVFTLDIVLAALQVLKFDLVSSLIIYQSFEVSSTQVCCTYIQVLQSWVASYCFYYLSHGGINA